MDLISQEQKLLDLLSPVTEQYQCSVGAFDSQELNRAVLSRQVFVSYGGANFLPKPTNNSSQQVQVQWVVLVRFKDLRTHHNSYPLLDLIRAKLTDQEIDSRTIKPLEIVSETPPAPNDPAIVDGIWIYTQTYQTTVIA